MSLAVDVVLRPIRTGNTFEETVERLLHAIKLGVFTEGERMPPERDLAARLGVGRATARRHPGARAVRLHRVAPGADGRHVRDVPGDAERLRPGGAEEIVRSLRQRGSDLDADALTLRAVLEVGAVEARPARAERRRAPSSPTGWPTAVRRPRRLPADGLRLHLAIAEVTGSPRSRRWPTCACGPTTCSTSPLAHPEHRALQRPAPRPSSRPSTAGDVAAARAAVQEHLDGTAALTFLA